MEEIKMLKAILNSYPYPIVFVDNEYVIRYMNRYACYHYYQERGYSQLIEKSLFLCHQKESSRQRIMEAYEKMKQDGKEVLVSVNIRNHRVYMQPVRGENGEPLGFFERFELNLTLPSLPHRG